MTYRERRGHPVAGALIGLVTVVGVLFAGLLVEFDWVMSQDSTRPETWRSSADHALLVAILAVVLVLGLWVAWRVGTGYWGRRRRPEAGEGGGDG